ncbi:hypothetical protein BG004_001700 [Podila humilis]|nr:hypothetical protein BG004_001700 [Podila humilis]
MVTEAEEVNKRVKDENLDLSGNDEGSQDEEETTDVFEVERVVAHRRDKAGNLSYQLKWQGYPDSDNTWEQEESVFCHDLVSEYWERYQSLGGRKSDPSGNDQKPPAKRAAGKAGKATSSSSRARSTSQPAHDALLPDLPPVASAAKRQRTSESAAAAKRLKAVDDSEEEEREDEQSSSRAQAWSPPSEWKSWDEHIQHVLTVEKIKNAMVVHVKWRNGHETEHNAKDAHAKFPQRLIAFYEAHLKFTQAQQWWQHQHQNEHTHQPHQPPQLATLSDQHIPKQEPLPRKRSMADASEEYENPKKRSTIWHGSRPDEQATSSTHGQFTLLHTFATSMQQQPQAYQHRQQPSRTMYGFDSPVSTPSTPVFEYDPFDQTQPQHQHHHYQQEQQQQEQQLDLQAQNNMYIQASLQLEEYAIGLQRPPSHPPTWAMEDLDLVGGVTTGLAASRLSHDALEGRVGTMLNGRVPVNDRAQSEEHSSSPQQQSQQGLAQYHYVMGFRASCERCQRRERGHFAHLVEK